MGPKMTPRRQGSAESWRKSLPRKRGASIAAEPIKKSPGNSLGQLKPRKTIRKPTRSEMVTRTEVVVGCFEYDGTSAGRSTHTCSIGRVTTNFRNSHNPRNQARGTQENTNGWQRQDLGLCFGLAGIAGIAEIQPMTAPFIGILKTHPAIHASIAETAPDSSSQRWVRLDNKRASNWVRSSEHYSAST